MGAVNIKKEIHSAQEYIEDGFEADGSSNISSVVDRYYSGIGSQPSPATSSQKNIKTERAEREMTNQVEVRERSVSPPASEFPLVPVEGAGLNLDLLQPSYPTPQLRGTKRGRGN